MLTVVLLANTSIGCFWLYSLRESDFTLKQEYLIELFALLMVPISVLTFLTIVVIKFVCFQLFEQRKKGKRPFQSFNEEENPEDINSVVGVYMRAIEAVTYEQWEEDSAVPQQKRFMVV